MWSCLFGILWEWCLLLKPGSFTGNEFNFESQMTWIFETKSDFIRVRMLKTATIWNWHDKNIKTWILGAFCLSTLATGELKYWKVYWAHSYKSYIQGLNSSADALFEAIWIISKDILDFRIYLGRVFNLDPLIIGGYKTLLLVNDESWYLKTDYRLISASMFFQVFICYTVRLTAIQFVGSSTKKASEIGFSKLSTDSPYYSIIFDVNFWRKSTLTSLAWMGSVRPRPKSSWKPKSNRWVTKL